MNENPVDMMALEELRSIMGDEFRLLIDIFINDSSERIQAIDKALKDNNGEALRGAAHSFKGSSSNLSAARLTELCKQLEYRGRDNDFSDTAELFLRVKQEFEAVRSFLQAI